MENIVPILAKMAGTILEVRNLTCGVFPASKGPAGEMCVVPSLFLA